MEPEAKSRIVVAAMELFGAKGYQSTSVADILQRAGANPGSLYAAFESKQGVLLAVLEAYRRGIGPMLLEPAWGHVSDPVEKVFALLAAYRGLLIHSQCDYGCPIGSLALELHEPDPPVRHLLAANFDGWTAAVRDCLRAVPGKDPRDTEALAVFVLVVMEGAVMLARTHRDIAPFDAAIAQLRHYFTLLGLSGPGPVPERTLA